MFYTKTDWLSATHLIPDGDIGALASILALAHHSILTAGGVS